MTRINLLVAKVVLLGICIMCISSVSVWAEEIKVSVTAYTLKECYHNKGKTASVLSIFLCKIFIGQFFKERQIFAHFSHRV